MVAIAKIEAINLPPTLKVGDIITGTVTVKNTGNEPGTLGVLITTTWDGKEYPLVSGGPTSPGGSMTFHYHEGFPAGNMPNGNAELVIEGRIWLGYNGGYITDDVQSWLILLFGEPTEPKPIPLLPVLLIVGIVLLLSRNKK